MSATISLYCAAKHFDDFEKAMIAALNHAGDSDSSGCPVTEKDSINFTIFAANVNDREIPFK